MNGQKIENVAAVISYIEAHLNEKLDLNTVANGIGYSKFHLHRMFTDVVGVTLHDYIQRRQLSEGAKLLVFSEKPILEIALIAGYESQQAFSSIFKSMYKQTPLEYRQNKVFYPLQLEFILNRNPTAPDTIIQKISYAALADIPDWMNFITLVIDGFPCLDESAHLERVKQYVQRRQALIMRDGSTLVGAAAYSDQTGSIDFLAVHPQYRRYGVERAFLDFMMRNLFAGREINITTFREGDKADPGQREEYKRLGFAESELLTEFGYPTQRLILPPKREKGHNG
ncbi:GNAT family N-acetyltransferase [Pseudoflavonifractor sp. 60]|uniref:helix-turn-helix domain-containing protein n=1 Tax=Pseudoflavonifractor sp. 60 TaxID=2304576 RepID=UPI00136DBC2A|nr:AraC family transcriptional regulator [Pseudoflavonifractor sp. 60]NBI66210.1 GNAT family N-acetyltransferase [Pseudoflavonifractor sp. 60]